MLVKFFLTNILPTNIALFIITNFTELSKKLAMAIKPSGAI
tara:strand:+ start:407 stop:529 length:123 start_codon:yes stop_codon:yes gene_type:complete